MTLQKIFQGGYKKNNVTSVTLVNNTTKTLDLSPGAGKRWQLLRFICYNPDDVARNVSVNQRDASDTVIDSVIASSAFNPGTFQCAPAAAHNLVTETAGHFDGGIIEDDEYMRVTWAAGGASSGGTDADGLVMQVMEIVKGSA